MKFIVSFKKCLFLYLLLTSIAFSARYFIDTESSKIVWIGRKVSGAHDGVIDINRGYVDMQKQSIIGGEIIIDMKSIKVLDMSDKYNKKLEKHLKNSDFFDVDIYPQASFNIQKKYDIMMDEDTFFKGDLKIKDKTINHSIPAKISVVNDTLIATGIIDIDRTSFGITYGSGTFFEDLTDRAIDDKFTLKFKIIASLNHLDKSIIKKEAK